MESVCVCVHLRARVCVCARVSACETISLKNLNHKSDWQSDW